jgi:hypothetical protein
VLEDAERLIAAWNERQAKRMPMFVCNGLSRSVRQTTQKKRQKKQNANLSGWRMSPIAQFLEVERGKRDA